MKKKHTHTQHIQRKKRGKIKRCFHDFLLHESMEHYLLFIKK